MRNHLLVDALRRNVGVMFSFVGSIPNEQFLKQKTYSRFSIYDHVKKLSAVQDVYLQRIEHYLTEAEPRIPDDDGDGHKPSREIDVPIHVLMRIFERIRNEQVSLIESATELTWKRTRRSSTARNGTSEPSSTGSWKTTGSTSIPCASSGSSRN